ncbi:membrane-spanning 4-domains subfamily A member 4A-like [Tachyglossus aculeatus]|uniref:membrane-spanning 4-domains subfamily A member 4A-like n=1 Tax=Tachyglossus aculeatus TaxID=9261 RepID=UPI0018F66125|nr:membrane-spanning 4-domains subfamily A member 4A-like [Tachyglossus aculeatus]
MDSHPGLTSGARSGFEGNLEKFREGKPVPLGAVQIVTGIILLISGIAFGNYAWGYPFWGMAFYIASGSVTISASKKLTRDLVRSSMILNIISAIIAFLGFIGICLALSVISILRERTYDKDVKYYLSVFLGIVSVMLVITIVDFCISIYLAVFGYKAIH